MKHECTYGNVSVSAGAGFPMIVIQNLRMKGTQASWMIVRTPPNMMQNRMTVSEISQALEWEQSAVSHQLQLLKQKKLVTASRRGKNMVYQLTSPQIMALIADAIEDRNLGR